MEQGAKRKQNCQSTRFLSLKMYCLHIHLLIKRIVSECYIRLLADSSGISAPQLHIHKCNSVFPAPVCKAYIVCVCVYLYFVG